MIVMIKKKLDMPQTIIALSVCGVIWLAVLFSFLIYNFQVVNSGILINEELVKNITTTNLMNTFKNHNNIADIHNDVARLDTKLDKLLNASKIIDK